MRRARTALLFLTLAPAAAAAQRAPLAIALPPRDLLAAAAPVLRTAGVATASHTAELIRNGFPALLHYKFERWTAGTFINSVKATTEWDMVVEYDALAGRYRLVRVTGDRPRVVGEFETLAALDGALAEGYRVPISLPKRGEKTYYAVTLDVEAMSLRDLDEVRRWLNGELKPAVRGRRNPGTAVSSGLRTFFVRILGGERLHYQATTGVFRP